MWFGHKSFHGNVAVGLIFLLQFQPSFAASKNIQLLRLSLHDKIAVVDIDGTAMSVAKGDDVGEHYKVVAIEAGTLVLDDRRTGDRVILTVSGLQLITRNPPERESQPIVAAQAGDLQ